MTTNSLSGAPGNDVPRIEKDSATAANTPSSDQLLPEKAEDYLREGGNIEDMPDVEDEAQKDKVLKETKH